MVLGTPATRRHQHKLLLGHVLPEATISRMQAQWDWKVLEAAQRSVHEQDALRNPGA